MKNLITIGIGICFLITFVLQYLFGAFPATFFAFPLNVILLHLWGGGLWILYRDYRSSSVAGYLLSLRTTITTLLLVIAFCLVAGFLPQYTPGRIPADGILSRLGVNHVVYSWPFVLLLFLLQSHLLMITFRGVRRGGKIRWRFLASHAGLLLALSGGFWGGSDLRQLRIPVYRDFADRTAYAADGKVHYLSYELQLEDFHAAYYENGMLQKYEARVLVDGEPVLLRVNEPHALGWGQDLYLTGYDMQTPGAVRYCVLQIVEQPWKYVQVAGILLMVLASVLLFVQGPKKEKQ